MVASNAINAVGLNESTLALRQHASESPAAVMAEQAVYAVAAHVVVAAVAAAELEA